MATEADFEIIRGDDVQQPFTVTLDQSRVLDGTETWRLFMRSLRTDSVTVLELVSPNQITIDATTYQPTAVFTPTDTPTSAFPVSKKNRKYDYDLEMTKDTLVETTNYGKVTVRGDTSR